MPRYILLILLFLPTLIANKTEWTFDNWKAWPGVNHYCGGHSQSPIDVQYDISQYDDRLRPLYLVNQYDKVKDNPQIINNGYTAVINIPHHYVLKNLAPGSEDYIVEQIHFHWGHHKDNVTGSEHLLNNESFPLEMHLVTYSSHFDNFDDASTNTRGLAVVAALFKVSDKPNVFLQPILDAFKRIRYKNDQDYLNKHVYLLSLFDKARMKRYFRYDGSLTMPNCYESIIWSVLAEPFPMTYEQLREFKSLHDGKRKPLINTYRPPQPLGTRKIFRSFRFENEPETGDSKKTKEEESSYYNHGSFKFINIKLIIILFHFLIIIK
ncbi:hypothetical protein I4U23_001064 [Adineta vaga]|nr:hypothetical protein I4U23_001064 [Adineta vaga]